MVLEEKDDRSGGSTIMLPSEAINCPNQDRGRIEKLGLGIDIGGTKIEGVALDQAGHILATYRIPSRRGNQAIHDDTVQVVRELTGQVLRGGTEVPRNRITIGLGIPGRIDSRAGTVDNAVNLGIDHMDLARSVEDTLELSVRVENDVNIAALGAASLAETNSTGRSPSRTETEADDHSVHGDIAEGRSLPPEDDQVTVFINLGTGLAAGIIRNGTIEHGANGVIGEIGHIPVDPHEFRCKCGQSGCLETVASGSAVQALWPGIRHPLPDMIDKARRGDRTAAERLRIIGNGIAQAIQIVALTIDPNVIILGGGLTKTGQPLLDLVREQLEARARKSHFIASLDLPERVRLSSTDKPIAAIGAALAGSRAAGPGIHLSGE